MNTAYFVKYPRTIDDLQKPHLISRERLYAVAAQVTLAAIDCENFITDLCADRQFIEDNGGLCAEGEPMKCLLVRQIGRPDGVLIVPESGSFVKWAAYITERG